VARRTVVPLLICGLAALGNAFGLTDPTRPTDPETYFGAGRSIDSSDWALQSILFASDRRIAVINGARVKEGDRIGSARVVRIRDSQVLLDTGGRRLTLHLLPQTVKVRP
jgi:MSHA biogenesis protein MshK